MADSLEAALSAVRAALAWEGNRQLCVCAGAITGSMEEIDIWRSAALLIKQHGTDAEAMAARYAATMIARGDLQGEAVWKRVRDAIANLRRKSPLPSDKVH